MLSRGRASHARRHCAERATLPAQLAADCTSDASASASDENSAALELHEPMVPPARERPPGCTRTIAGAGCPPVVNRAELAGVRAVNAAGSQGRCRVRSARQGMANSFDRPSNEPILASDQVRCGALRRTPVGRCWSTTVAGTAIRPSGGSLSLSGRRYIAPPCRREEPNEPACLVRCHLGRLPTAPPITRARRSVPAV